MINIKKLEGTGTDKQVKYAQDIIQAAIYAIENQKKAVAKTIVCSVVGTGEKVELENSNYDPAKVEAAEIVEISVDFKLQQLKTAKNVIESKNLFSANTLEGTFNVALKNHMTKQQFIEMAKEHGYIPEEEAKKPVTVSYKIYGVEGHRQRESFCESYKLDFSEGDDVRILEVLNSDKTGTNDYSIVKITRNTYEECEQELEGQLSDGIFENSRVGRVVEI